jgi:23S rRNA (uracil1939-C5)-methyltransferase
VAAGLGEGGGTLLDAYAGVGLFSTLLGRGPGDGRQGSERAVIAVESNPSSAADARINLPSSADVVVSRVEDWSPRSVDLVVADPSRRGLEARGADLLAATGAGRLVLVSCDPASLGRDARLLVDRGFALEQVTVVDLFGHTSHVEAVSVFAR